MDSTACNKDINRIGVTAIKVKLDGVNRIRVLGLIL